MPTAILFWYLRRLVEFTALKLAADDIVRISIPRGLTMSSFSIEGWFKPVGEQKSTPIENIDFYLSGDDHLHLEQAEERLQKSHEPEELVDVNLETLQLVLPRWFGDVADCQFRVYLRPDDQRGQFHLLGHRASDGCLIYTNAVLIDQLM